MDRIQRLAYAIVDGALIPIDRFADQKPYRYRPTLSRWQKAVRHVHARIRACGERAIATLKTWALSSLLSGFESAMRRRSPP